MGFNSAFKGLKVNYCSTNRNQNLQYTIYIFISATNLSLNVRDFLPVGENVSKSDGCLNDECQDGDEGQHQHLQQLEPPSPFVRRVGCLDTALPRNPGIAHVFRTDTSQRSVVRHGCDEPRPTAVCHLECCNRAIEMS